MVLRCGLGSGSAAMGLIAVISGSVLVVIEVCGQTRQYIVTELSSDDATRVSCKLNNHGEIAGRADSALRHSRRATVWNSSNLKSKHLRAFVGADYSSAFDINVEGGNRWGSKYRRRNGALHVECKLFTTRAITSIRRSLG